MTKRTTTARLTDLDRFIMEPSDWEGSFHTADYCYTNREHWTLWRLSDPASTARRIFPPAKKAPTSREWDSARVSCDALADRKLRPLCPIRFVRSSACPACRSAIYGRFHGQVYPLHPSSRQNACLDDPQHPRNWREARLQPS